jgi:ABC-type transporter Mla MlaB component
MAAPSPRPVTFAISGPIARSDLLGLCDRVGALLEQTGATEALCDVTGVLADAVTVDALARLQLAARRHRCRIRLLGASEELRDLIAFMGLDGVLPE